jgi:hypothetical protein
VPEVITDQVSNFLIELGSSGVWSKPNGDSLALIGYLSFESDVEAVKSSVYNYLDELRALGFPVSEKKLICER